MLKSKLHRGCVTDCNINYAGNRFITYAIPGKRGGGTIMVNGAAARLAQINDRIIIVAYGIMDAKEQKKFKPQIALLDKNNRLLKKK